MNHSPKILIIDDEKHIRRSFADYLEDHDYGVLLAENGRVGLEMLRSGNPDLVLLDLRMPGMDGFELLREGRKRLPDLPIIVISGANLVRDVSVHSDMVLGIIWKNRFRIFPFWDTRSKKPWKRPD